MKYQPVKKVQVSIDFGDHPIIVGQLAWIKREFYFEYDPVFLESRLEISPFKLPLNAKTFKGEPRPFEGLFGVFNDSLPDGWGRLLLDRALRSHSIAPEALSPLDRLTHVGKRGMGALLFEPDVSEHVSQTEFLDLYRLANESAKVLDGETEGVFQELLELSGSSTGARPKIMIGVAPDKKRLVHGQQMLPNGFEHWMVKFASTNDQKDIGAIEYAYSLMAKAAGVDMMQTCLFPAPKGKGYFGVQRFDRVGTRRLHMHSLSGLIHADHQLPSLDYQDALRVTLSLTRNMREVTKMFRLAAFNVGAHNRDDHSKNFSFLMDEQGSWRVSPAYDLTFSYGPGGEHCTMIMGEGRNPGRMQLIVLADKFGIPKSTTNEILDQVFESVSKWTTFADEAGVTKASIKAIKSAIHS